MQQVKVFQQQMEDGYLHINNGGQNNGIVAITHELADGSVHRHMMFQASSSLFGARTETAFRILNLSHVKYLIDMLTRTKAVMEADPEGYSSIFDDAHLNVQVINGLVVEMVWGPAQIVDGAKKSVLIGHNYRRQDTGEIVRYEPYNGPEIARMEAAAEESHDGGDYADEPGEGHDAGGYGESTLDTEIPPRDRMN